MLARVLGYSSATSPSIVRSAKDGLRVLHPRLNDEARGGVQHNLNLVRNGVSSNPLSASSVEGSTLQGRRMFCGSESLLVGLRFRPRRVAIITAVQRPTRPHSLRGKDPHTSRNRMS